MLKKLPYFLTAVALALFAQRALADEDAKPAGPDGEALFKQLDTNSDGQVATDEVPQDKQGLLKRLLRTADKDGNGRLSREEFVEGLKRRDPQPSPDEPRKGPLAAPGNPGGFDPEIRFRRMDRNGDGKVTLDEVPEERRENFSKLLQRADANGDKALTLEEFSKVRDFLGKQPAAPGQPGGPPPGVLGGPPPGGELLFRTLDADGDGTLSADELAKASDALKKLDKDGDGKLTRRELMPAHGDAAPAATDRPGPEAVLRRLMAGDKNNDGKLSREELPERLQRGFDRLDANGDGSVSAEELKTGLARLQEAGGGKGLEDLKKRLNQAEGDKPNK